MLSCELVAVARLLAQHAIALPPRLAALTEDLRALMPEHEDQDLRPPLVAAAQLLDRLAETATVAS